MKLEEIDKLLGEITQGDWGMDDEDGYAQWSIWVGPRIICKMNGDDAETEANARLIAAAPTIIKKLVERVRVLENVAEWAREVVEDGEYDVKFECKDEAPIQSELLLNLERALSRLKEAT